MQKNKFGNDWTGSDPFNCPLRSCCSQSHHRGKHSRTWMRKENINDLTQTCLTLPIKLSFIRIAWFIFTAYFWGYLDHLLSHSPGLSSPAGGLFRRVPLGSSSLRLTLLRGSAPGISCTAAGRCGRPLCCRGFPPVCWGLGATQIKRTEGQDFSLHHPCFRLER